MICEEHKFIFTRVAKTGSSTLLHSLKKYGVDMDRVVSEDDWRGDLNHVPMPGLKKRISDVKFNSYFKFGFVRNPWDRLVSTYHYLLKWHTKNCPRKLNWKRFDNFDTWVHVMITKAMGKYGSQYHYVDGCDFIGKFENLQEDFNIVCDKIGISHQELPHKNATKHKHYTEYYNEETKQIVTEKYVKDIEAFGYEFGD